MNKRLNAKSGLARKLFLLLLFSPVALLAQVPVDDNGEIIGAYEPQTAEKATGNEDIPLLSTVDLEELVGPIALYPDDLLAIVLPAAAYPLQIVEAARFLEALEDDPSLEPDPEWDDSVVALINYPEVIELLNDDIDWTWRLGEAVVSQQGDVVTAVETFRDRAYTAGNLKSDSYQNVTRDEGVIEITPLTEDVIYVPYYEPERVVVYQPRPAYYYYPRPYPVYYYPYSSAHAFDRGFFWGVTTAFSIGWYTDSLHVLHHSYNSHPYYGHSYRNRWWYRRPSISLHNRTYVRRSTNVTINRYYGGDNWRPRQNRRDYVVERRNTRVTRNRHYPKPRTQTVGANNAQRDRYVQRSSDVRRNSNSQRQSTRDDKQRRTRAAEPITFRERPQTVAMNKRETMNRAESSNRRQRATRQEPRYRREDTRPQQNTQQRSRATPAVRRSAPTPKIRQSEPTARARPPEPARRSQPQRQASREPREKSARQPAERKSERKSERRSERKSEQKSQRDSERKSRQRR